ncbi:MAG: flavodoxin domain-containing protein [Candidatus Omnitrophica bacterium]|nr:flavodoxin domain-containing protein [Candidatus Omnitrophota bacterium]
MKTGIIYFSLTGNTEKVAQRIGEKLEAEGKEVEKIALCEEKNHSFLGNALRALFRIKGKIKETTFNPKDYETFFFGTPVWAGSPAPALLNYLERCQGLQGKEVCLFVTYGSGLGKGRAIRILERIIEKKGGRVTQKLAVQEKMVAKETLVWK